MNKLVSLAIGALIFFQLRNPLFHTVDDCDFSCRVQGYGLMSEFDKVSENLYHGKSSDIRYAIKLWEESPSHKAVLDDKYEYAIIIVEKDKNNKGWYYILMETAR